MDLTDKRIAVLAELARQYHGDGKARFGNTAAVKMCYFLQNVYGVDLNYRFSIYTYGPFDQEILFTKDLAKARGILDIKYVNGNGDNYGYDIKPATSPKWPVADLNAKEKIAIKAAVATFSHGDTKDLELWSTVCFVYREFGESGDSLPKVVQRVKQIKPHFSENQIQKAIDFLQTEGVFIKLLTHAA